MRKRINNKLIRSFGPCYDPLSIGIDDSEVKTVRNWIIKYMDVVKSKQDIICGADCASHIFWLLCRKDFMSDRDLRLFSIWCIREIFKYRMDEKNVEVCDVAEEYALSLLEDGSNVRYNNGEDIVSDEELNLLRRIL